MFCFVLFFAGSLSSTPGFQRSFRTVTKPVDDDATSAASDSSSASVGSSSADNTCNNNALPPQPSSSSVDISEDSEEERLAAKRREIVAAVAIARRPEIAKQLALAEEMAKLKTDECATAERKVTELDLFGDASVSERQELLHQEAARDAAKAKVKDTRMQVRLSRLLRGDASL